ARNPAVRLKTGCKGYRKGRREAPPTLVDELALRDLRGPVGHERDARHADLTRVVDQEPFSVGGHVVGLQTDSGTAVEVHAEERLHFLDFEASSAAFHGRYHEIVHRRHGIEIAAV